MIDKVTEVYNNEITQDMINKAVTDGFFDRCTRIIERKGESADLKTKKRPAE